MYIYNIGDKVRIIKIEPLGDNTVAPPLELNKEYPVKGVILDSGGNQHLDLGLVSEYNYIRSFETNEELPDGDRIHYVHPSRVELV